MRSLLVVAVLVLSGCSSTIGDFDFANPGCRAHHDTDRTKVEARYLGSGGLYIRWRDEALLLGPQFSNPSFWRAAFWKSDFDRARIERALQPLDVAAVRAILIGHSHYDHIGDVPVVAREPYASDAKIYVNATGRKLLHAYPDVESRTTVIHHGDVIDVSPSFRVRVIRSGHAPQICRGSRWPCVYARGDVREPWTEGWSRHRLNAFRGGETFAFDIEIRDGDTTRFRIYYNDSSASEPLGQASGEFDLAVLTMAQWKWVKNYPAHLLESLQPRHVLISHWDNFFKKDEDRFPFVTNLTKEKVRGFIEIVEQHAGTAGAPTNEVCGVKREQWTMPVPGSSLLFVPRMEAAVDLPPSGAQTPTVVEE